MAAPVRVVLAVVPDLFFATRIAATAKAAGVTLELVAAARVVDRLGGGAVALVILDLHAPGALERVADCKRAAPATPVLGFVSHVETALRRDALAAGADAVLPRSAFTTKLPAILAHGLRALEPGPGGAPRAGSPE
jgi:DNA-binding NarL/FixJ family response regulator